MSKLRQIILDTVQFSHDNGNHIVIKPDAAEQAIEAYIAEREKKAYIQGGIDEILRHDRAMVETLNQNLDQLKSNERGK